MLTYFPVLKEIIIKCMQNQSKAKFNVITFILKIKTLEVHISLSEVFLTIEVVH